MVLDTNVPRRVEGDSSVAAHRNVGDAERLASMIGGAPSPATGGRAVTFGGALVGVLGAELFRRGATGHCRKALRRFKATAEAGELAMTGR